MLSSERREGIAAAIASVDVGFAAETATRIGEDLGDWATAYREGARASCRAHVEHEISDALFDRRRGCLRRHRETATALVSALARPTVQDVEHAVEAVARLPSIAACADDESLLAEVPLPQDAQAREAVAEVRSALARVEAQVTLGRYEEAVAGADELAATVDGIDYRPLRAQWALARGRALELDGKSAQAVDALTEAAYEGRSAGDDRTAASAETWLVFTVGARMRESDRALWWADHAAAAIARLPSPEVLAARLDWHRGTVQMLAGDEAAGVRSLRSAVAGLEAAVGPMHPDTIEAEYNLAVALRRSGDLDRARELQQRVLDARRQTLGPTHPETGRSLAALGVIEHARGDGAQAREYLEQAVDVLGRGVGQAHPALARVLLDLAKVHGDAGDFDVAQADVARAREIEVAAFGATHPRVALADLVSGDLWRQEGEDARAREAYQRALAAQEKTLGADHPTTAATRALLHEVTPTPSPSP